jgi:hypothetical protein
MSRGAPLVPRRTPDKPTIEGFLTPRDVGKLRPSDSLAPGAFEAIRRGCSCDRLANDYGKGASNGFLADARRHVIDPHCPLHGSSMPSVPIAPQRCPHCGEDLELADDGKTVACTNQCDVLVVGPPEAAPRVRRQTDPAPAICTRCGKPIVREPGQRGRPPKYHPECRSPGEIAQLQWKERNNERIRQEKRARDGAA